MRCLRLFALCSANTYSPFLFFLGPVAKLKSHLHVCQMELTLLLYVPSVVFFFSEALSKMALYSDSHSVAPSARACQEVCLPKLEPGPVYTNSSEKYGRIIILVVSFNVTSLWWQPLHALSATLRVGCWSSDQGVVWIFLQRPFYFATWRSPLTKKLEQYGAKQINMTHKAVIEFAVVVPRINTDSKYCTAGRAQTRFSELNSVAEWPCSIPVWPQAQKNTVTAAGKYAREVCKCKHIGLNKHQDKQVQIYRPLMLSLGC